MGTVPPVTEIFGFTENLKAALFADASLIQGFMMISVLSAKDLATIFSQVREILKPKEITDGWLRQIYSDVQRCGLGIMNRYPSKSLSWREERLAVANHNLSLYNMNPSILTRIVAIDEMSVLNGRLVLVAACIKGRFLAYEFVVDGKATNKIIHDFLANNCTVHMAAIGLKSPVIIWDNINVHKGEGVVELITNNKWTVWPQARNSADMQPLDFADFKTLMDPIKKEIQKPGISVEEAKKLVVEAIDRVNKEISLQGIALLPDVWECLVKSEGLSTRALDPDPVSPYSS